MQSAPAGSIAPVMISTQAFAVGMSARLAGSSGGDALELKRPRTSWLRAQGVAVHHGAVEGRARGGPR